MAGKPGRSGGARQGAGRPPHSVKVRDGQSILAIVKFRGQPVIIGAGAGAFSLGAVTIERRGEWRLTTLEGMEIFFKMA